MKRTVGGVFGWNARQIEFQKGKKIYKKKVKQETHIPSWELTHPPLTFEDFPFRQVGYAKFQGG